MLHFRLAALFTALSTVTALPTIATRHGMPIVQTTTLENGHVIDWVTRPDNIARPPAAKGSLSLPALNGPEGAVPYLRSTQKMPQKVPPPTRLAKTSLDKRDSRAPPGHMYAYVGQTATNIGGGGGFSLFDPYVNGSDFSLIQMVVGRFGVQHPQYGSVQQTLEAGWQKYPSFNPAPAHLFTFFNTNGYNGDADYVTGYNTDVKGWVQYDKNIYPGYQFGPCAVDGGAQNDVALAYTLLQGNWWLTVNNTYIGYYPASLFNVSSGTTLQTSSDHVGFYGEIATSQVNTTTDMGSGQLPSAGYGKTAYIRNMYYADTSSKKQDFNGQASNDLLTNPDLYQLEKHYPSGGSWGSFMYLGGPGYGGNVGS